MKMRKLIKTIIPAAVMLAAVFTVSVSADPAVPALPAPIVTPAAATPAATAPVPAANAAVPAVPAATTVPAAPAVPTPAVTPTAAPLAVKIVDLVIFAGQSNMSGRGGSVKAAPGVPVDTGYEFRYGTCPTGMYPVQEPFGIYSNGYLCDLPQLRGGTLVSSFMNSYYKATGVPVLGFSAARGGSSIGYWQTPPVQAELARKYDLIKAWCTANHIHIRKEYAVWLQGETDGVARMDKNTYRKGLENTFAPLFAKGLDQVFVITIGQYAGLPGTYDQIIAADLELCAQDPHFSLGSDALRALPAAYLTDGCHYNQAALNIVGSQSGNAAAIYSKLTP